MLKKLLPLVFMAGCSHIVPQTLRDLQAVNPMTADPADFQIHLHLPAGLDLPPDSGKLTFSARTTDKEASGTYTLWRQDSRDGTLIMAIAPQELDALRAVQAEARALKSADPKGTTGSLEIDFGLCLRGDGPDPDAPVSADIVLEYDGPARPFLRPQPVGRYMKMLKARAGTGILPCPLAPRH
ncbi:hypothetical protein [Antarctobacter heliothermus]|uniref:Uncharacterized protein n=1 Tax=Antarctobacter heliothermus TaxID=74033 RepID=A0A239HFE8_9RHOB|nr:hypothetical protein [Antarctobacter heliothermus]SNS80087.1 hypothetical protein SAMN04488078_103338 [Antarctobacter heliothermus]